MSKQDNDRKGTSIAFYSYKGGVGRSMALVNIACLLAKKEKKVLIIDWDVEAPGLHLFFKTNKENPGLVDLITDLIAYIKTEENNNEEGYARFFTKQLDNYIEKDLPPVESANGVRIDLLKAGKFNKGYSEKLAAIDWQGMYRKSPALFRTFAYCLEKEYDYILIDSRTGLADSAGITTLLMPQKLVLVFALNHQNINGVIDIATQAINYRLESNDYRSLDIYPLPARIENKSSTDLMFWISTYLSKFEKLFKEKYLLDECTLTDYFDRCFIPYFPAQAHGENIPVLTEPTANSSFISFNYNSFLTVLLKDIPAWETISIEQEAANVQLANELFQKATKLNIKENFAEQIQVYNQILELTPENYIIYANRGLTKGKLNDLSGAIQDFDSAISIYKKNPDNNPDFAEMLCVRGILKVRLGFASDAINDTAYLL